MRTLAKYFVVLSLLVPALVLAEGGHEEAGGEHEKSKTGADLFLLGPSGPVNKDKATRPEKVTLESPAAFAKIQGNSTTLKWTESKGAESYQIQVATDPNFKWLVKNEFFHKGTSFELGGLESGKQYFWRVAGMNPNKDSEYTKSFFAVSSFEVK